MTWACAMFRMTQIEDGSPSTVETTPRSQWTLLIENLNAVSSTFQAILIAPSYKVGGGRLSVLIYV